MGYEGPGACKYQKMLSDIFELHNAASSLPKACLDKFERAWVCFSCVCVCVYVCVCVCAGPPVPVDSPVSPRRFIYQYTLTY